MKFIKILSVFFVLILSFFMFSFKPIDIVRNISLIRNIFYPDVYERKGLGKDTDGENDPSRN